MTTHKQTRTRRRVLTLLLIQRGAATTTQHELAALLREAGFGTVPQPTISRDLAKLNIWRPLA